MIKRAIIQVDEHGDFPNAALCAASLGFRERGVEVVRLVEAQIEKWTAIPEVLVFGFARVVREYLERLGVFPPSLDYPVALQPFLNREFEVTTLGQIRRAYNEPGPLVFVKPVRHKEFNGHLVGRFRDLIRTTHLPADTPVYKVEYVAFNSEWRFYVRGSQVVGSTHYSGEPLLFPKSRTIGDAARTFYGNGAPYAYALDFGVTEEGETCLVEVNDMISLGSYGLDPAHYAFLIECRWKELMAQGNVARTPAPQQHPPDSLENVRARYAALGYCGCGSRFEDHRPGDPPCDDGYSR